MIYPYFFFNCGMLLIVCFPVLNEDKPPLIDEIPLEENINRLQFEGEQARTVDEAIRVLRLVNKMASLEDIRVLWLVNSFIISSMFSETSM